MRLSCFAAGSFAAHENGETRRHSTPQQLEPCRWRGEQRTAATKAMAWGPNSARTPFPSSLLPKPKATAASQAAPEASQATSAGSLTQLVSKRSGPPPYRQRDGFQPRTVADFGDGGAFPEINMMQYPYDMGKKKTKVRRRYLRGHRARLTP